MLLVVILVISAMMGPEPAAGCSTLYFVGRVSLSLIGAELSRFPGGALRASELDMFMTNTSNIVSL